MSKNPSYDEVLAAILRLPPAEQQLLIEGLRRADRTVISEGAAANAGLRQVLLSIQRPILDEEAIKAIEEVHDQFNKWDE